MVTLFGVLPNGLLAESDSRLMLNLGESSRYIDILLAVFVLTILFSRWYRKQVSQMMIIRVSFKLYKDQADSVLLFIPYCPWLPHYFSHMLLPGTISF